MSTNPIPEQGVKFSQADYELVSHALTSIIEHAKANGRRDLAIPLVNILVRIKHAVMAGQTLPDETLERFGVRFQTALMRGDDTAVSSAISDFATAMLRVDPDPGRRIAELLVAFTASAIVAQRAMVLTEVLGRIDTERSGFEAEGWPEDGDDGPGSRTVYDWLRNLIDGALENAKQGRALFPEGADDQVH